MKRSMKFSAKESFWEGVASLFSICDEYKVPRRRTLEDDAKALRGDWYAVGNDIRRAMDKFNNSAR